MINALRQLEAEYIEFICSECNLTTDELFALDNDKLYDQVYDLMCDIECAETPTDNTPITLRCSMASDIVTILGNTL